MDFSNSINDDINNIPNDESNQVVVSTPNDTEPEPETPKVIQTPTHPIPDYYDENQIPTTDTTLNTNIDPNANTNIDSNTTVSEQNTSTIQTESKTTINPSKITNDVNKPISNNDQKSPVNSTVAIGIGSVVALLVIAVIAFVFLKKKKNNRHTDQTESEKDDSFYQINSEFLKTDNHITLPFNENTTEIISESAFYKNNSALFDNQNDNFNTKNDIAVDKKSVQKQISNESNKYCIDLNFETPSLDLAFPKPVLKNNLSNDWLNHFNNTTIDNKEMSKSKYITNNVICSPEKTLATEEISKIGDDIASKIEQENKNEKVRSEATTLGENKRLKSPTPISTGGSSSSLNSKGKASLDEIINYTSPPPQTTITPKSILKKNSIRSYNGSPLTRNTSSRKTTIGHSGINTENKNSNGNMSVDNMSRSGSLSQSLIGTEDEIGSFKSLGRGNTVNTMNSIATTASNMTGVKIPPLLTAFHHALPTPPTPKSTKFFGPDGELLPGQIINDKLMVPDVLNDAMERHDIHIKQDAKNFPNSYCTIRRKNRNSKTNEDDISKKQDLEGKNLGHNRNQSQDFVYGNGDKLALFNTKSSYNRQEYNTKENHQNNMISKYANQKPPLSNNANNLHYSKTLPRNFNSSKKFNENENGIPTKKVPQQNSYNIEEERTKLLNAMNGNEVFNHHVKRNSMEAEFLIQNANVSLTCFEEDLLKNSITEKDKLMDINSVISILREERSLLNQIALETPK
ncbi:hypothetical protein BCR36DRAFT_584912 [Piromyces finnis]|uniref:Uncharacterized protein n=1 Tax=Piromyces finnis TaxID=1754191 RepID=A0A1Y1V4H5_9FUNG|nr:hypothetical protein BCR36DRAFT_584912 [Piromyces finnis]|eukprot:ORX47102.1 hypothetical protein BCR36DRAFT_584912 [Piromyces finnis]